MSRTSRRGLLACALLSLLAGCGNDVEVGSPELSRADRTACDAFLDALPDELDDLTEVEVSPADAPARAW